MRKFGDSDNAQMRLSQTNNDFFVGLPYFDQETSEKILSLPVGKKSLRDVLQAIRDKKSAEGDNEVCTSHDLAPIFERVLEVSWAQIKSELKASKKRLKRLEKSVLKI